MMRFVTQHVTSAGGRRTNEDALREVSGTRYKLLALADGLGGHGDGSLAARQCVETAASAFARAPGLSNAALQGLVDDADQAVAALRRERQGSNTSMRTTLALLAVYGADARWAHVGDTRVYWFRDKVLMQRTRDHSVAELVMSLPEGSPVAEPDPSDRNRLLRAVGGGNGCRAELGTTVTLRAGDAFLLCSDGIWRLVSDSEITACLSDSAMPLDWCIALEQRLQERLRCSSLEEHDNYSMISGMVVS
jgi:serine/threonine protein phosphatase PrpC